MGGTGTNMACNVTSGSGAPQTPAQTISDAAQWLTVNYKFAITWTQT